MGAILTVRLPDGRTRRVQFLGGNDLDDPERRAGTLTYSFDKRLVEILKDSAIWGKIALPVLMAFTSKYAVSLYENTAQWTGLGKKTFQEFSLAEFREMIGVEPGKYAAFGALNMHVLKPALLEINALAPFNITVLPVKSGKKVTHLRIGWWNKNKHEMDAAWQELRRSKVGRRARITGQIDHVQVHDAFPSQNRMLRRDRIVRGSSDDG
jgi:plasmid replication initiation protein